MKKIHIIIGLIITVIICIILFNNNEEQTNLNKIERKDVKIVSQKTVVPYSYYSVYAWQSTSNDYTYDNDTFYYNIFKNADDSMWDLSIHVERYTISKTDFENYNAIVFVKRSKYSYELVETYNIDSKTIKITLKEEAISEPTEKDNETFHGGIIFIPKEIEIEDIEIYTQKIDFSEECKISNRLASDMDLVKCAYTKEQLSEKIIKKYSINKINDINFMKIENQQELSEFAQELKLNREIKFNYQNVNDDIWENNNILVYIKRTKGYFYCNPEINRDSNLNIVWSTNNLKINVDELGAEKGEELLNCCFILVPKQVDFEKIQIEVNQLNINNIHDNEVLIDKEKAIEIAKTYFTEVDVVHLRILDINNMKFNGYNEEIEEKENSHFRKVWYVNGSRGNMPTFIYLDATTGEIFTII